MLTSAISLLEALTSRICTGCGEEYRGRGITSRLCPSCADSLRIPDGRRCERCGELLGSEIGLCMDCRENRQALRGLSALRFCAYYGETTMRLLVEYKQHANLSLGKVFAATMLRECREMELGERVIVPVPSSSKGKRARGFDHVKRIAVALGAGTGYLVVPAFRRKRGRPQKELNREERWANMQQQTVCTLKPGALAGRACLLVDDVCTSGASLSVCASLLLEHGVTDVVALVLLRD